MEIKHLIVKIPLKQKINNPYMDGDLGETNNLIGIVAGDEFTISQLIDLSYKDSQQEGMPILHFANREELEEVCKKAGIDIWEHELCSVCGEALRGSFTINEKGYVCFRCE